MDKHLPLTPEELGISAKDIKANLGKFISDDSAFQRQQEMIRNNIMNIDIPVIENPIIQTNRLLQQQNLQLTEANSFLEKQLNEAKENNTRLNNELQDLKRQVIALQTIPKKWYQKIRIGTWALIVFVLGVIVTSILDNFISVNFEEILNYFKSMFG